MSKSPRIRNDHGHFLSQLRSDTGQQLVVGGGGSLSVTDGVTTVSETTSVTYPAGSVTDLGGGGAGVGLVQITRRIELAFDTPDFDNDGFVATTLVAGDVLDDIAFFSTVVWDDGSLDVWVEDAHVNVMSVVLSAIWAPSVQALQVANATMRAPYAGSNNINDSPSPPIIATGPQTILVRQTGSAPTTGAGVLVLTVATPSA